MAGYLKFPYYGFSAERIAPSMISNCMRSKKSLESGNNFFCFLDLNAVVEAMIGQTEGGKFTCLQCGKIFETKQGGKKHADVHLGLIHPCVICQRICKTRNALSAHYTKYHPQEIQSPWTTS